MSKPSAKRQKPQTPRAAPTAATPEALAERAHTARSSGVARALSRTANAYVQACLRHCWSTARWAAVLEARRAVGRGLYRAIGRGLYRAIGAPKPSRGSSVARSLAKKWTVLEGYADGAAAREVVLEGQRAFLSLRAAAAIDLVARRYYPLDTWYGALCAREGRAYAPPPGATAELDARQLEELFEQRLGSLEHSGRRTAPVCSTRLASRCTAGGWPAAPSASPSWPRAPSSTRSSPTPPSTTWRSRSPTHPSDRMRAPRAERSFAMPRHILGLSGGKDSSALAIYLRERVPEMEYVFCDTGKELPETYEFLTRMEAYLGKPVERLVSERDFDHYLQVFNGYLPSSRMRWCTRLLKLKPFEQYVGDGPVVNYVGIRADEHREGYISTKPNITSVFPFRDDGIAKADVLRILEESGVGIPSYYRWRSRSGCTFCFFQRKEEWVGLKREHPELFEEAKRYEKTDPATGERFTWRQGETLDELVAKEEARGAAGKRPERGAHKRSLPLLRVFAEPDDGGEELPEDERPCAICEL